MDADVMITVAFCLEVFFFGLGAAVLFAREARKARPEAATENRHERAEAAEMRTRPNARKRERKRQRLPVAPSNGRDRQTIHLGRAAEAREQKERTS